MLIWAAGSWAHPRSRGENFPVWFGAVSGRGSSPLARGKLGLAHGVWTPGVAHPRSRGENVFVSGRRTALRGSSPLARGKPCSSYATDRGRGLIPARAGKTTRPGSRSQTTTAHPRSRGENAEVVSLYLICAGSSPLARGKPDQGSCRQAGKRLIPARAGKTTAQLAANGVEEAHPRSRGENESAMFGVPPLLGSSPLARGKLKAFGERPLASRLIPARAGKTSGTRVASLRATAHPRSRGENMPQAVARSLGQGSSPLARGKRSVLRARRLRCGSSPLARGKRTFRRPSSQRSGAHPRSRGENFSGVLSVIVVSGSSPLARGKLDGGGASRPVMGLIPARAGKTRWTAWSRG